MPTIDPKPALSIILPAYNAELFLETSLDLLAKRRSAWPETEVIVVDDGSTDATALVASQFSAPWFRFVQLPRNLGKGAAVRAGMLAARGDSRIFLDADLPYDLAVIDGIMAGLQHADVVVGARDLPTSHFLVRPTWPRRLASSVLSVLLRILALTEVTDTQCGVKGFRATAAERLFGSSRIGGFVFDVEILSIARRLGLGVERVPVRQVRNEPSTLSLPRHAARMLLDLLRIAWRYYVPHRSPRSNA